MDQIFQSEDGAAVTDCDIFLPLDTDEVFSLKDDSRPDKSNYLIAQESLNVALIFRYKRKSSKHDGSQGVLKWRNRLLESTVGVTVKENRNKICVSKSCLDNKGRVFNELELLPVLINIREKSAFKKDILKAYTLAEADDREHCLIQQLDEWKEIDKSCVIYPLSLTSNLKNLPYDCLEAVVEVCVSARNTLNHEKDSIAGEDNSKNCKDSAGLLSSFTFQVIQPPRVSCQHHGVSGNHFFFIKVSNFYPKQIKICDVLITPSFKTHAASPSHGSSDQSEINGETSLLPDLVRFEVQDVKFPISLEHMEEVCIRIRMNLSEDKSLDEFLNKEIHLSLQLSWCCQKEKVLSQYMLPDIKIRKPGLSVTALCLTEGDVFSRKSFYMRYTIINNLKEFMHLRLVWNPEKALIQGELTEDRRKSIENVIKFVICHEPVCDIGLCKLGSVISVDIGFQILKPGFYELGQHMKLNLQYSVKKLLKNHRRGSISSTRSMPTDPSLSHSMPADSMKETKEMGKSQSTSLLPQKSSSLPRDKIPSPGVLLSVQGQPDTLSLQSENGTSGHACRSCERSPQEAVNEECQKRMDHSVSAYSMSRSSTYNHIHIIRYEQGVITPDQVLKCNCQVFVKPEI